MKNKNSYIKLGAMAFAFMLLTSLVPMSKAALTDNVNVSLTVSSAMNIAVDDPSINPAIVTGDSTTTNDDSSVITVDSNNATGFKVTLGAQSPEGTPVKDRLCRDDDSNAVCDNPNYFLTDQTTSFLRVTTSAYNGSNSTYQSNLLVDSSTADPEVFRSTDTSAVARTLNINYNFFADYSIVPQSYKGTLVYTIASAT